jgi:predicted dehydrogenase
MEARIRYGLVGTGMMGLEHIRNLAITPGAELVAIADPESRSLDWARQALGDKADAVTGYADAAALAAHDGLDAVIVASPNYTHRRVVEPLFDAGLHILCEKPLATTIADARWIAERAAHHEAVFWTAMEYRYMPPVAALIERVHNGAIGRLRMLAMREHRFPFLPKVGDWNRFARNTGGTMVEKCCHFFDLMRFIVRSEPVRVYCSGGQDVNHLDERYGGERPDIVDNSYTVVDFADGTRAMLDLCMFADGAEEQEEIVATGDAARLDVSIPGSVLTLSPRVGFGNAKRPERRAVDVDPVALAAGSHHGSTFYQHQAFARAVRGEGPVEVSAEDGLHAVAIGVAAEISLREHRVVSIDEVLAQPAA